MLKYLFPILIVCGCLAAACGGPLVSLAAKPASSLQASVIGHRDSQSDAKAPPVEVRELFFNPFGDCVQDSISEHAVKVNHRNAANLLWNTKYGPAIRGGSNPSRVSAYCQARGIDAWVITGASTWSWMQWAGSTGRGAAVSLDKQHFQTVVSYDKASRIWYVSDNRTPRLIEPYDDQTFYAQHLEGGQWCVILNTPPPPPYAVTEVRRVPFGRLTWFAYLFA